MLKGNIEHIDDNYILGWILNTEEVSKSLTLDILINNKKYSLVADLNRQDIEEIYGAANGKHGFRFEFQDFLNPGSNVIRIRLPELENAEFKVIDVISRKINTLSDFINNPDYYDFPSQLKDRLANIPIHSTLGSRLLINIVKKTKIILILFTNRTGSNLVTDMLTQMGIGGGVCNEPFLADSILDYCSKHEIKAIDHYIANYLRDWSNDGICFIKISWDALFWLTARGLFSPLFNESFVIFCKRHDKIAQSISYLRAIESGKYFQKSSELSLEPSVNLDQIKKEDVVLTQEKACQVAKMAHNLIIAEARLEYLLQLIYVKKINIFFEEMIASKKITADLIRHEIETHFNINLRLISYTPQIAKQSDETEVVLREKFIKSLRQTLLDKEINK